MLRPWTRLILAFFSLFPSWAVFKASSLFSPPPPLLCSLFSYLWCGCSCRCVRIAPLFTVRPSLWFGDTACTELLGIHLAPPPISPQGSWDWRCRVLSPYLASGDSNSDPHPGMARTISPVLLCLLHAMYMWLKLLGRLSQEVQDLPGLWSNFQLHQDPASRGIGMQWSFCLECITVLSSISHKRERAILKKLIGLTKWLCMSVLGVACLKSWVILEWCWLPVLPRVAQAGLEFIV